VVQAPRVSAAARPGMPNPQPRAVAERYCSAERVAPQDQPKHEADTDLHPPRRASTITPAMYPRTRARERV